MAEGGEQTARGRTWRILRTILVVLAGVTVVALLASARPILKGKRPWDEACPEAFLAVSALVGILALAVLVAFGLALLVAKVRGPANARRTTPSPFRLSKARQFAQEGRENLEVRAPRRHVAATAAIPGSRPTAGFRMPPPIPAADFKAELRRATLWHAGWTLVLVVTVASAWGIGMLAAAPLFLVATTSQVAVGIVFLIRGKKPRATADEAPGWLAFVFFWQFEMQHPMPLFGLAIGAVDFGVAFWLADLAAA